MEKQESIDAWFALVPEQAKATARRLFLEVDNLRREEIIYPPQDDILNALAYVAPEDVRAVILGQDPYHGPGQAMGLSFSVPKGEKLPPSLRNIYKEMASDLGCGIPVSGDLSAWAQQGVLLLNTTLTVREHEANSHSKLGWQVVTTAIVEACMRLPQPVVFLAWGRPAIKVIESAKSRGRRARSRVALALVLRTLAPMTTHRAVPPLLLPTQAAPLRAVPFPASSSSKARTPRHFRHRARLAIFPLSWARVRSPAQTIC